MDAYEATRVVFSRIQALDPENAPKIMGLLLLQDHGEKEMIRLAFGPEALLHSIISMARKDLGLLPPSSPSTPSGASGASPFLLSRQNSASRMLPAGGMPPPPLTVASPSWAPPSFAISNSNGMPGDELHSPEKLISPNNPPPSSPFHGASGDLIEELQLQDQLSFFNDPVAAVAAAGECRSPNGNGDSMLYQYGMGWGVNGYRQSSLPASAELCFGSDPAGGGLGWRPCLYYARGYCKNGSSCRFMHGLPDDAAAAAGVDALVEQQCQELLLRSKSPRLGGSVAASHLMASAFPYSPTGSVPLSPPSRCLNFLQSDSQRAAAAAALLLGGEDPHKFMGRSRMERSDFASMVNPGSRQIYLTFPADSTFREEDVSNYFSIYGPVQDVRIPYQQKRMFGFVTFVYPETVKLILAKGNPHFVCDARVLVKPYKEKGKVPDKFRKQNQSDRGDFSGCSTPTGLDPRDPFELQQLGARMLYNSSQEALLRRKLEEQQQAAELQQAIELQGRRFMGLQLLDLKNRNTASLSSPTAAANAHINPGAIAPPAINSDVKPVAASQEETQPEDKNGSSTACGVVKIGISEALVAAEKQQLMNNNSSSNSSNINKAVNAGADKEESGGEARPNEDSDFQERAEHNLPDSPFASPTKACCFDNSFAVENTAVSSLLTNTSNSNNRVAPSTTLLPPTSSFNPSFFSMPRFSFDHGAIGM